MSSNHTYTGGEHYWISYASGTYEVRREDYDRNTTVFRGSYLDCCKHLNEILESNVDYDLNI